MELSGRQVSMIVNGKAHAALDRAVSGHELEIVISRHWESCHRPIDIFQWTKSKIRRTLSIGGALVQAN